MKKNVTYIAYGKLEGIAKHLGCNLEVQKGFTKVTREGIEGKAVYIGNTKGVGRVDLSGFTLEGIEGVIPHSKAPTSKVVQELDFSRSEPEILRTFSAVLKHGLSAESQAVVGKRNARRGGVAEPSAEEIAEAVRLATAS